MTKLYNKISVKEKRKYLRKNMPTSELKLWKKIRNKQLLNIKFRRQYSIGNYIVDFYSAELKLAIELDGETHFTKDNIEYENKRTKYIESLGIKIIRYSNYEIINNFEGICYDLEKIINELKTPLYPPL